jgi:hypothetical protein
MAQQELSIGATGKDNCSPPPWEYVLTNTALIEQVGRNHYVYGLWGEYYGYWEVNISNNSSREFVPTWSLFDDSGIWLSQSQTRNLSSTLLKHSLAIEWKFEADAAFAAFFSEIPHQIRSLVSSMGRHQGIVLDLLNHEPALAPVLDEELHQGRADNFLSCLDLYQVEISSRAERKQLAKKMALSNSVQIFAL